MKLLYCQRFLLYILLISEYKLIKFVYSIQFNNSSLSDQNFGNNLKENNVEIILDEVFDDENDDYMIYNSENIPIKFWDEEKKEKLKSNEDESIDDIVNISSTSSGFRFYNFLSVDEKKIYDTILSASYESPPDVNVKMTVKGVSDIDAYIEEISVSAEKVFTALVYENPLLWWIGSYQVSIYKTSKEKRYNLIFIILPENSIFENYSPAEIESLTNEVINEKNNIMDQISSFNLTTDYAIMRYVHDYLIIKIQYNLDENLKHIRTIYGALVDNECVCEGYSEAFQYILHQYGINCIIARSSTHEWNFVEMNGKWYIVDVTYDDPMINGESLLPGYASNLKTQFFLIGTDHKFSNGEKYSDKKDHVLVYSAYSEEVMVTYPEIETSDYIPNEFELQELKLIDISNISIECMNKIYI